MSISLDGVVKRFAGLPAVDGVSAEIADGAFFVVLGPSGCGKSTLLRLIAGLEVADAGRIALGGHGMSGPGLHVPPEARALGVVFQSYALWPHMDVRDNVAFPAEAAGLGRRAARAAAEAHLEAVALEGFAARRPAELSGGQRQRVALARCLAGGARTILMDEPLANLDPHLRAAMEAEIARFHRTTGATTFYITHDQREAMALADRVAVMWEGRFLQVGAPEEVHDRPSTELVARFIGRATVLEARIGADGMADLGPARVPARWATGAARPQGPVKLVVRPGDLAIGGVGEAALAGRVVEPFYRGGQWEAGLAVPGLAEPLPLGAPRRLVSGEEVSVVVTGGWVLPEAR